MKPLLVLLLDGDPDRRQEIATLLRQAGHQVALLGNGATGTATLDRCDLLVVDPASPTIDFAGLRQAISPDTPPSPDSLQEAERRHLALVLRHTSGNKRKAAQLLGISRSTLLNKVRKYGLDG
jgi:DNA-binding NtrC family response regulator